jgi:hypothetical protein
LNPLLAERTCFSQARLPGAHRDRQVRRARIYSTRCIGAIGG